MFNVQFNAGASRKALQNAMRQLQDMTPIYEDIGELMVNSTRERFAQGRAPDGSPWAPKSEATLERYRRLGYGSLTRPLIGPGKALSRQIQKIVARNGVTIGSSLIYSGVMQDGAQKGAFGSNQRGRPIPWGNIVARVWLGISASDEKAIVDIVDEHLQSPLET